MAKKPKRVFMLGMFPVDVEWPKGYHVASDGDACSGEFEAGKNKVYVSTGTYGPWSTFFHELWHKYAALVGDDDMEKMNSDARRVETFLADLVTNHWELLKELRKEKLKELEE